MESEHPINTITIPVTLGAYGARTWPNEFVLVRLGVHLSIVYRIWSYAEIALFA